MRRDAAGVSDLPAQHGGADIQCGVQHRGGRFASRQQRPNMAEAARAERQCESRQGEALLLFIMPYQSRTEISY